MYFGPNQGLLFVIYLQGAGPGISVPFNVQHVAHIGADNVEALLQAAKDDPKLLPSFLLPEGLKEEKDEGQKMVETDDNAPKGKRMDKLLNNVCFWIVVRLMESTGLVEIFVGISSIALYMGLAHCLYILFWWILEIRL